MRTSQIRLIYVLSVLQAIISMANSIINRDNMQMTGPKLIKYRKKFPPSIAFLKHFTLRASEVIHRIGILSLIWTVCGGVAFSVVFGFEMFCIFILIVIDTEERNRLDMFQSVIVMTGDLVFDEEIESDELCCHPS